jgi:hypothetical protein
MFSIVLSFYNEQDNLEFLFKEIKNSKKVRVLSLFYLIMALL